MDQLSDRRYRLNGEEVGPVMLIVEAALSVILEEKMDLSTAETLFRVLYRFKTYRVGRPTYPEPVTWESITSWLNGPLKEDSV